MILIYIYNVCHLHYTRILCTHTIFMRDLSGYENRIVVPSNAANWPICVMGTRRLSLEVLALFSISNYMITTQVFWDTTQCLLVNIC
jgi:hypothetical protein